MATAVQQQNEQQQEKGKTNFPERELTNDESTKNIVNFIGYYYDHDFYPLLFLLLFNDFQFVSVINVIGCRFAVSYRLYCYYFDFV